MPNVLVVDDQACIRQLLCEELISEGYQVAAVGDAESVSGHLRFSKPDLVLLDLYLEGAEGFGVLRDIKAQDPDVPVIIFTAYDSYADDPRLLQADGYVIKSMVLDELKAKIADVLGRQPSSQQIDAMPHPAQLSVACGF